ncbi:SCO6880 family protein [Nocardioides alcanivorans]|uniref:SCO6880 family protein n=1 Tax=Nocardioides alcanivorans TaxID=2897352 RepID=UPI001F2FA1B1
MNAATSSKPGDYELQPVKFSRLTRRGVLFGLAASQLVVMGIGAVMLVFSLYVGGGASLIVAFPVILFCAALAFVGVGGHKLIQWLPIAAVWLWRSTGGQLIYRRRVVAPRPVGTLALPGDAAPCGNGSTPRPAL